MYAPSYTAQTAANSYQTVDVQTASPMRLVAMLYNGLETRLAAAQTLAEQGSPEASGMLVKALDILAELQSSLDLTQGGEIAGNLYGLYQYAGQRLRQSDDRIAAIAEIRKVFAPLASAWNELAEQGAGYNRTMAQMVA